MSRSDTEAGDFRLWTGLRTLLAWGASKEVDVAMIDTSPERRRGATWKVAEWVFGLGGAITTFMGVFILLGPETEYVGLGGDWSWRIGDVSTAWTVGLILGGLILLAVAYYLVVEGRRRTAVPPTPFTDLAVHLGVFFLVNAFVWVQDFALGGGLDYAFWMTIPWAVGLALHGYIYWLRGREVVPVPVEEGRSSKELLHH